MCMEDHYCICNVILEWIRLSFSRMGAKCTGVDLSDDAIKLAREINDELKVDAKFVCCNVYDTLNL